MKKNLDKEGIKKNEDKEIKDNERRCKKRKRVS